MLNDGAVTLFRVRGVPVRAHWTLLLLLPYLVVVFSMRLADIAKMAGVSPSDLKLPPIVWGLLAAVGLFASVTIHELAHTWVAIRTGGRVRAITLMMLGGVSQMERLPQARDEATMAAVGPATSLLLGGLLLGLARIVTSSDLHVALHYLARLNFALGIFNLLPAFPMDGGRVLRGLLATRLGLPRATRVAALTGKGLAVALFLLGSLTANFLLMLIALFVYTGAGLEARGVELHAVLADVRLAQMMVAPPPAVPLSATWEEALDLMRRQARRDLLVIDADGRVVGILLAEDLAASAEMAARARIADLEERLGGRHVSAFSDETAAQALDRAAQAQASHLVVVTQDDATTAVGLVGPQEIANTFALHTITQRRRAWPVSRPVHP